MGGTGFFLEEAVPGAAAGASASKGETKSNMDLRVGEGGP